MDTEVSQKTIDRALEVFDRVTRMLAPAESLADDPSLGKVELFALRCLFVEREPTMSRLARTLGVALSTSTKIVDRLTEKGLVERKRNDGDRRVVRVVLTPRGEYAASTYRKQMKDAVTKMLAALSRDKQQSFIQTWEEIVNANDRERE